MYMYLEPNPINIASFTQCEVYGMRTRAMRRFILTAAQYSDSYREVVRGLRGQYVRRRDTAQLGHSARHKMPLLTLLSRLLFLFPSRHPVSHPPPTRDLITSLHPAMSVFEPSVVLAMCASIAQTTKQREEFTMKWKKKVSARSIS